MTNAEVIDWLLGIKHKYIHGGDEQYDELRRQAIDIAVSTLNKQESLEKKITYLTEERPQNHLSEMKFKAVRVYRQNGLSELNTAFEQGWQFVRASDFVPDYSSTQGYIEYILFKEFD